MVVSRRSLVILHRVDLVVLTGSIVGIGAGLDLMGIVAYGVPLVSICLGSGSSRHTSNIPILVIGGLQQTILARIALPNPRIDNGLDGAVLLLDSDSLDLTINNGVHLPIGVVALDPLVLRTAQNIDVAVAAAVVIAHDNRADDVQILIEHSNDAGGVFQSVISGIGHLQINILHAGVGADHLGQANHSSGRILIVRNLADLHGEIHRVIITIGPLIHGRSCTTTSILGVVCNHTDAAAVDLALSGNRGLLSPEVDHFGTIPLHSGLQGVNGIVVLGGGGVGKPAVVLIVTIIQQGVVVNVNYVGIGTSAAVPISITTAILGQVLVGLGDINLDLLHGAVEEHSGAGEGLDAHVAAGAVIGGEEQVVLRAGELHHAG